MRHDGSPTISPVVTSKSRERHVPSLRTRSPRTAYAARELLSLLFIGQRVVTLWFTDRVWRLVYEETDGLQYVIDGCGVKVYGVWFIPRDDPTPDGRHRRAGISHGRETSPTTCRGCLSRFSQRESVSGGRRSNRRHIQHV
jgi:hypothetical protein